MVERSPEAAKSQVEPEKTECASCHKQLREAEIHHYEGTVLCVDCAESLIRNIEAEKRLSQRRRQFWELEQQDEDFDDEE